MSPSSFTVHEGFDSQEARKKRLGQYFSGLLVAKLLVALSARPGIHSACDPMGGRGDMLVGVREVLSACAHTDGIEIDPIAHGEGMAALRAGAGDSTYLLGSAFDGATVSGLAREGYDLVVTNPPYVRYQLQKVSAGQSAKLPSALEVRNGLHECLSKLPALTDEDRRDFLTLTEGYSGLSDLAVPAWILCAALVKPGGTLAMVVPEAWLNRDYASVVRYLLLRWFRLEFIVEDAHAAWFSDAQVKTTLLVARRIPHLDGISGWTDETYLHVSLPSNLANATSLVGRSRLASEEQPELAFAHEARRVLEGTSEILVEGASWQRVRIADQVAAVTRSAQRESWFQQLEQHAAATTFTRYVMPPVLASWFNGYERLTTLGELGVEIGQGLRTGANRFFYADVASSNSLETTIVSSLFEGEHIVVPSACAIPVVRKQADVCGSMSVSPQKLAGVALAFHGWALPEDAAPAVATPLPAGAAGYVRRASLAKVGDKPLPSLSAVAPNVRKPNPKTGAAARCWYMLPDFAPRHRPDLFVARVNSESPRVGLNPGREALIDANFSTLWLRPNATIKAEAAFAYLNSSIAAALFEYTGAVLGGGALKLEATHLRSLPVPSLSARTWVRLAALGTDLAESVPEKREGVMRKIDATLCRAMFGAGRYAAKMMDVYSITQHKQVARTKRHDTRTTNRSTDMPD